MTWQVTNWAHGLNGVIAGPHALPSGDEMFSTILAEFTDGKLKSATIDCGIEDHVGDNRSLIVIGCKSLSSLRRCISVLFCQAAAWQDTLEKSDQAWLASSCAEAPGSRSWDLLGRT